jgi:hypothetical protein
MLRHVATLLFAGAMIVALPSPDAPTPNPIQTRGCCSHHGGVSGACCGSTLRCNDGTCSPSSGGQALRRSSWRFRGRWRHCDHTQRVVAVGRQPRANDDPQGARRPPSAPRERALARDRPRESRTGVARDRPLDPAGERVDRGLERRDESVRVETVPAGAGWLKRRQGAPGAFAQPDPPRTAAISRRVRRARAVGPSPASRAHRPRGRRSHGPLRGSGPTPHPDLAALAAARSVAEFDMNVTTIG